MATLSRRFRFGALRAAGFFGAALVLSGFGGGRYRAGVHPTVEKQIEYALTAAKSGRDGEAGGYMRALLIGGDIKYALMFEPESEAQRPEAERAIAEAAEEWTRRLDDKARIRPAEPGERPDLIVRFQPDVSLDGRRVSGYIRWTRTVRREGDRWTGEFDGQVYARTTLGGRPMATELMRNCLGHEMGHMFGLPDAAGSGAIMGPLDPERPILGPNEDEVATVRAIREDARAILPGYEPFTDAQ